MSIVLRNLALSLTELGVEVDIFAPEHGPCDPEFFLDDPGFYDEAELLWRSVFRKPPRLIHLDAEDFSRSLLRLRPLGDSGGAPYDLVHSHYWRSAEAGLRLARQLGVPHVFTYHTIAEVKERAGGAPETPERKQAELLAVRESDAVVTFTKEEAQSLVELLGLDPRRARTVRMGVDLGIFTPQSVRCEKDPMRARMDIDLDERVMLFVGRVEPFKGPDMLVRALAHMRTPDPLRLVVIGGEESSFEWLADIARAHGVAHRLDWRGPVAHESS